MSAQLRRAVAQDWPAIERLLSANGLPLQGAQEHLEEFVVAVSRNEVVGCAGIEIHGRVGLLRSVAVDAAHRGAGIAQELTAAVIHSAGAMRLSALYLLTTTAAGYFARRGFVPVARNLTPESLHQSEEFRGACPASATMQVLVLDATA